MSDPGFEARDSAIAGLGLFATRSFTRGERIAPYQGRTTTTLPSHHDATHQVYALEIIPGVWLDGSPTTNPGRYANHSCAPNAELIWESQSAEAWIVAADPIQAGQEVTFDYGFSLAESLFHPCRCGAAECVGRIIAAPLRPQLRRHLRFSRPRD